MAMMKSAETIDSYLNLYPVKTQKILQKVRNTIRKIIPDAEETMRYGLPTFRLNENLVHFGAFENHLGFYPTPLVIEKFKKAIEKKYNWSKGAVQFPLNEPIPYDLIIEMTEYRIEQARKKTLTKPKKKK